MDLLKIRGQFSELQFNGQWAANAGAQECFNSGIFFAVADVYRSQARQDQLYAQGRTTPGKIVTWTHHSRHTARLAFDIVMEQGTYDQAANIFAKYGIYRQPDLVKLGDVGHYDTGSAMPQPQTTVTPLARLQGYIRLLKVTKLPDLKRLLPPLIKRLAARLGINVDDDQL